MKVIRTKIIAAIFVGLVFSTCQNSALKWDLPKLASLNTLDPELISDSTVQCSANVTDDGGSQVRERGICYNNSPNPTLNDRKVSGGTGKGEFTVLIQGLRPDSTYYFRAYATNKAGTAYGNQTIRGSDILPVVRTDSVKSITSDAAVCYGNIIKSGTSAVLERGICYNTTSNPTISDNKIKSDNGTGSFSVNLTGLTQNTKYYCRAYATNSSGISYGKVISFTTSAISLPNLTTAPVTAITLTSAVSGGNVISDGGSPITEKGICYNTSSAPTINNTKIANGSDSGNFSVNLTNLKPGTIYYIRAYANNISGTGYGNEISFTTPSLSLPIVTTVSASAISVRSVNSGGNLISDGGSPITDKGICYSTSPNPTTANTIQSAGSGTGSFILTITGLHPGTTYFMKAYATNNVGTGYGEQISFTTASIFLPVISTQAVSAVTNTSALIGGEVSYDGGDSVTERGICYNTSPTPMTSNHKIQSGSGQGSFTMTLSNLAMGTQYFLRAYAINKAGTAYGNEISFTTTAVLSIGMSYQGGIIFQLNALGDHGLIAATEDKSTGAKWGCPNTNISNAQSTAIGTGLSNTLSILSGCSEADCAARICRNSTINGFSDWYLPSKDELNLMYQNLKNKGLGNFSNDDYWSSSQDSRKNSWSQSFSSGKASSKNKSTSTHVRPIRSF